MKITKNEKVVYLKKEDSLKRLILSSAKKIQDRKKLFLNAFAKESELFKNVYYIDRYSNIKMHDDPFSLLSLPRQNLFSPLRLLLASEDISSIYIEENNLMQFAIKTNNMEAFQALFKSPDVAKLINGYNQPKTVNTIGTCFSLYVKDVWKNNYDSLAFPFYTALAQHPSCVFNTQTQLEKLSDAVFISEQKLKLNFTSIEWACLMERYGDKSIYSLEILSNISEPGSTFFIQTTLDWIIRNQNPESPEIINLILTTLGGVNASLPRSTSTLLDFPSLKSSPRLPAYTESLDSLLHIALYKHGAPLTKVGSFLDSYGTFEKLCYYNHRHQNKFGLTALMMCAIKGWKTFAQLIQNIYFRGVDESIRLEYKPQGQSWSYRLGLCGLVSRNARVFKKYRLCFEYSNYCFGQQFKFIGWHQELQNPSRL